MCFLWKLEKENSFYDNVTGKISQGSVELDASQPIDIEREVRTLTCFFSAMQECFFLLSKIVNLIGFKDPPPCP